ncbi:galectin-3-like isoform X4 [Vanessa cardui]|uniref:galectin-3-like isoform X4 n=1 Tax=Vanessa cardui TaxID=171605 RepID=UPI001F14798E|nr:galectin-3-like isoform X4 [Vanessa cardui]
MFDSDEEYDEEIEKFFKIHNTYTEMDVRRIVYIVIAVVLLLLILSCCLRRKRNRGRVLTLPVVTAYPVAQAASPYPAPAPYATNTSPYPPYPTGMPVATHQADSHPGQYPQGFAPGGYPAAGAPYPTASYPSAPSAPDANVFFGIAAPGWNTQAMPPSYEQAVCAKPPPHNPYAPQ